MVIINDQSTMYKGGYRTSFWVGMFGPGARSFPLFSTSVWPAFHRGFFVGLFRRFRIVFAPISAPTPRLTFRRLCAQNAARHVRQLSRQKFFFRKNLFQIYFSKRFLKNSILKVLSM